MNKKPFKNVNFTKSTFNKSYYGKEKNIQFDRYGKLLFSDKIDIKNKT